MWCSDLLQLVSATFALCASSRHLGDRLVEDRPTRKAGLLRLANATLALGASSSYVSRALVDTGTPKNFDEKVFHAARHHVLTAYGHIAYVERGEGDVALFLHGFPLNGFQWRGAIDRLSAYRRCIAPDFLGLGYTEVWEGQSVAPDAQVAMLISLLDALGVARADVIANDAGGTVAQLLVAQHPARVRTLLLTNCDTEPASLPAAMRQVIAMSHAGAYADSCLAPWLADKALARSSQGIGGMCFANPAEPGDEAIDCYLTPLVSSPWRKALVHAYAAALDHNPLDGISAALHRCKVPTRIVWGRDDAIFPVTGARYLDRNLGHSLGVRYVDGAKLFYPEERPDVIAEEARKLWGV